MDSKKIRLKPFAVSLFFLFLVESIAAWLNHSGYTFTYAQLGGIRLLELILFLATIIFQGDGPASIGLSKPQIRPGIIKGIIWSLCFGGVVLTGFGVLFVLGINPIKLFQGGLPKKTGDLIAYFIVGGFIAPVVEEVFFRGILYGFIREWGIAGSLAVSRLFFQKQEPSKSPRSRFPIISGVMLALFLSTLLFAVVHPKATIVQITGGIIFAISYEKENLLMTPIVIHILANNALFVLALLPGFGIG